MASVIQKTKKRNWATVCYPESVHEDWLATLRQSGLQVAISPLHDRDLEADERTPKKPHWHIILVYSGPTSFKVVKELCDRIGAVTPQSLEAVRGYYRYLTHKDNPEKAQYDEREIQNLGGFSIMDFVEMTRSEVHAMKKSLQLMIRDRGFTEYHHLMDWILDNGTDEEYDVAANNTYFFDKYLTSRRNALREATQHSLKERLDNQQ